jgi:hypothetical protein
VDFLSSFGLSTPSDPPPAAALEVESGESDESDNDNHNKHDLKGRSSDEGLRLGAVSTPLHHIDWECASSCRYGRQCASNAGFLPYVVKLRNMFWGPKGSKAPSSSARREKIKDLAKSFHRGGDIFVFGFICSNRDMDRHVSICEPTFFKALGSGKTRQWISAMERLVHGDVYVEKLGRPSFKHASVRAYIAIFMTKCDIPPSKNMQHIKILPFPNLKQFYEEYTATFGPSFLVTMGRDEGLR